MSFLLGKEHTLFRVRNGGDGLVLNFTDRKWTKPLVLLINNRSYSDAEIFPHAFRSFGLGKLVGQPTAGHVIGVRLITLLDGSTFRVPHISVSTSNGVNLERGGVDPDFLVDESPDEIARGIDAQLEKAVEVLQKDVAARKKNGTSGVASTPGGTAPATPMANPMPMSNAAPPARKD
jgi:tricorn protease